MPFDQTHKALLKTDAKLLDSVNSLLDAFSKGKLSEITPGSSFSKPKILWEVENYVQLSIHRVVELGEGAAEAWNNRRPAVCFILTRALMENVSSLVDLTYQTDAFVQNQKFIDIHNLVVNRLMGGKLGQFPPEVQIPNVLTAIDKTDKYFPDYKIRYLYDFLSEFAHPNSLGMHGLYGYVDPVTHVLKIDPSFGMNTRHFTVLIQALARALSVFRDAVLKIEGLYPLIVKLAINDAEANRIP